MIAPGHSIVWDAPLRIFVHADCAKVCSLVTTTVLPERPRSMINGMPHGLKPRSLHSYKTEWGRYTRFMQRRGFDKVPGRDVPWSLPLLAEYMQWRARTCKPSTLKGIFSVLSHFGTMYGFLLPTSRDDDDSLSFRRIRNIKKQLSIDYVELTGEPDEPERCTPLGKHDVSMLLSSYGVVSRERFDALPRLHRHHLFAAVAQHAKAMRYGHFLYRSYTIPQFLRDGTCGAFSLFTDWHRYSGRERYCLRFEAFPRQDFLWYELRDPDGTIRDTIAAATLMAWHFERLQRDGETKVFAPVKGEITTREARQKWLRESLLAALPADEEQARALVADVTPHSFRPGLAGDARRAGMRLDEIAIECRWHGIRNARMYSTRTPLSAARLSAAFRMIQLFGIKAP